MDDKKLERITTDIKRDLSLIVAAGGVGLGPVGGALLLGANLLMLHKGKTEPRGSTEVRQKRFLINCGLTLAAGLISPAYLCLPVGLLMATALTIAFTDKEPEPEKVDCEIVDDGRG